MHMCYAYILVSLSGGVGKGSLFTIIWVDDWRELDRQWMGLKDNGAIIDLTLKLL